MGRLYVLLGQRLGGRVICKKLRKSKHSEIKENLRFLEGFNEEEWHKFTDFLESDGELKREASFIEMRDEAILTFEEIGLEFASQQVGLEEERSPGAR